MRNILIAAIVMTSMLSVACATNEKNKNADERNPAQVNVGPVTAAKTAYQCHVIMIVKSGDPVRTKIDVPVSRASVPGSDETVKVTLKNGYKVDVSIRVQDLGSEKPQVQFTASFTKDNKNFVHLGSTVEELTPTLQNSRYDTSGPMSKLNYDSYSLNCFKK